MGKKHKESNEMLFSMMKWIENGETMLFQQKINNPHGELVDTGCCELYMMQITPKHIVLMQRDIDNGDIIIYNGIVCEMWENVDDSMETINNTLDLHEGA
jgi:hypothetical protein